MNSAPVDGDLFLVFVELLKPGGRRNGTPDGTLFGEGVKTAS
jgi:hypothetical protein